MKFVYKDHVLEIEDSESEYCCGFSKDIENWWSWSSRGYKVVVNCFIKAVDNKLAGIVEDPIYSVCNHNGSTLVVRKKGELYTGESTVHGRDWCHQSYDFDFLVRWFKSDVDEFLSEDEFFFHYKGYDLTAKRKEKDSEWYVGTSKIGNEDWTQEGYKLKNLIRCFEYCVDFYFYEQSLLYEYF